MQHRLRRGGAIFGALLLAGFAGLLGVRTAVGARVRVLPHERYRASPEARALHARLVVADLHADSLLARRDPTRRNREGHVDLSDLGRAVVDRAPDLGMVVDLAHSSPAAMHDVLSMEAAVVYSHGGVKGTCDNERNLTDDQVRAIAARGGVIGIGYWVTAVGGTIPEHVGRAMTYVRDMVGPGHVALGSDFDGGVTTGLDASELVALTQTLLDQGWSEADVEAAMGANVVRLLLAQLPSSAGRLAGTRERM